jgi:hypothetical protein
MPNPALDGRSLCWLAGSYSGKPPFGKICFSHPVATCVVDEGIAPQNSDP